MRRCVLAIAVAVLAAGCGGSHGVDRAKLAVMVLPRAAYGDAVARFPVDSSSGWLDNAAAAAGDLDPAVTAKTFVRDGRRTGYSLAFTSLRAIRSGSGLIGVSSSVHQFDGADGAARYVERELSAPGRYAEPAKNGTRYVGTQRFPNGVQTVLRLGGSKLYVTYAAVQHGKLVGEVSTTRANGFADDRATVTRLLALLAARLERPPGGSPAPLPESTRERLGGLGSPADAPDLRSMAPTAADLGSAQLVGQGYTRDPASVADYLRKFQPAKYRSSTLGEVDVNVELKRSALDAYALLQGLRESVSGAAGQAFLRRAFGATGDVRFSEPEPVAAGDAAFVVHARLARAGRKSDVAMGVVVVDRAVQSITLIGARIAPGDAEALLRTAGKRMRHAVDQAFGKA